MSAELRATSQMQSVPHDRVAELRDAIVELVRANDTDRHRARREVLLSLGDHLVELLQQLESDGVTLRQLASDLEIPWSTANQAHWIASTIPKGDPARRFNVSYTQLRTLAGLTPASRKEVLNEVENRASGCSSRDLLRIVARFKSGAAASDLDRCVGCDKPITDSPKVTFRVRGEADERQSCSIECAAKYFRDRSKPGAPRKRA